MAQYTTRTIFLLIVLVTSKPLSIAMVMTSVLVLISQPGDFVHTIGDAHVYVNHMEPLKKQLRRKPRPFPTVSIKRKVEDIEDFKFEDFELHGYEPHFKIAMDSVV